MTVLLSQRALFDIPRDVAWFNAAYYGPQLNSTRDRLVEAAGRKSRPWERSAPDFFADAETVRTLASAIFGGDAEGWAVIPSASYGLSTAARALEPRLRPGDEIVLIADDFPSNVLAWRRTAAETGAAITTVRPPADGDWTAAILQRIGPATAVVAVPACRWTDGARIDLEAVGEAARRAGAALVVDATQSLGAMPLALQGVRPDFLVAAGYKWLLCPYGVGLMFVSGAWRDARPLEESWMARVGADDFAALVQSSDDYMPGARRFDVGEKCTAQLPGAIAALEQIRAWGVEEIGETLAAVNARLAARLEALGFALPPASARCPHLFGARLRKGFDGDLAGELAKRRVYVSRRGDLIRFAPHLHVDDDDVTRLEATLAEILGAG